MRWARASSRRRVLIHARIRVDDTDFLSSASDGSGVPNGIVTLSLRCSRKSPTRTFYRRWSIHCD